MKIDVSNWEGTDGSLMVRGERLCMSAGTYDDQVSHL